MHDRRMLDKKRTVTVSTRIEPDELRQLKQLADECGICVCAYLRDLFRLEITRAGRPAELNQPVPVATTGFTNRAQ